MADAKAAAIASEPDVDADDEGASGQPRKKLFTLPSRKALIIGAAALLVLAGGGAGAYFTFFKGQQETTPDVSATKPFVFVDLPEIVVNLANSGTERTQYLRIKVVLELPEQKMLQQIQPVMPRVMDAFQTYLRELRASDLDGSAGLYRLKEELTRRVNASISPSRVNAVLFKEIIVQ
jgi:flagellar FliL protein